MRAVKAFFCVATLYFLLPVTAGLGAGHFEGRLVLNAMDDGALQTAEVFAYVDALAVRWEVPAHSKTDGASVPKLLWGLLPPLHGRYLKAAVVHDYNCVQRTQPWQRVHEVFFESMIDAQVEPVTAKVMYAAVYAFGPRWDANGNSLAPPVRRPEREQEIAFEGLKLWMENNPDLERIRERISEDRLQ